MENVNKEILLTTRLHLEEPRNPIALLDLAQFLRMHGFNVDCYYIHQLEKNPENKKYDIVGLSVLQARDENAPVQDAIFLKNKFNTKTVVGGKWVNTLSKKQKTQLIQNNIDIHCGPGEIYFVKNQNGEIDFSSYPPWNEMDFLTLKTVYGDIMTSRGCPFHCRFCHNTEKKVSFFNVKRTVSNIELLLKLNVDTIILLDDIFTIKSSHMEQIYNELENRGLNIKEKCEFFTHVNFVNETTVKWIKKYSPTQVQIGIESGDDEMLGQMAKGFDSEKALNSIKMLYKNRINIFALFLIGFPGESINSLNNTFRFIRKIRNYVSRFWVSYYQPVRGTIGWELAQERNSTFVHGKRNTDIVYIDPNISSEILIQYKNKMQRLFSWRYLLLGHRTLVQAMREWKKLRPEPWKPGKKWRNVVHEKILTIRTEQDMTVDQAIDEFLAIYPEFKEHKKSLSRSHKDYLTKLNKERRMKENKQAQGKTV